MAGHRPLAGLLSKLEGRHPSAATGNVLHRLALAFGWHRRLGAGGKLAAVSADVLEMVACKVRWAEECVASALVFETVILLACRYQCHRQR